MFESQIIFKRGIDLDGCNCFRIPFGTVTKKGVWIVGGDARYTSANDHTGIDIVIRRSLDGGETWLEPQIVFRRNHLTDGSRKMDACILADKITGKVFIFTVALGSGNSITKKDISFDCVWKESCDDGETWSEEKSLHYLTETNNGRVFQGPGSGIQMEDGTLVIPCQKWVRGENGLLPTTRSSIIYSKDSGRTWQMGKEVAHYTTEATVVEVAKGKLMLVCRNENREESKLGKKVYTTTDMGITWVEHETTDKIRQYNRCMGSSLKFVDRTGESHIIFTGPNNQSESNTYGRGQITLQKLNASETDWDLIARVHMLPSLGYSCLVYDEIRGKLFVVLETTEQVMGKGGDPNVEADCNDPHAYMDIQIRDITEFIPLLKKIPNQNKNVGVPFESLGNGISTIAGSEPRVRQINDEYWIRGTFIKEDGGEVGKVLGRLPLWVPCFTGVILPTMAWDDTQFKHVYCEIIDRDIILRVPCVEGKMTLHIPEMRIGVFGER